MSHKVTKCEGKGCFKRESCLRFTIPERIKPKQDVFVISPWKETAGVFKCEFFIEDETVKMLDHLKVTIKPKLE